MLDQLMFFQLMQLQHRNALSCWHESEDAFYEDFGEPPLASLYRSALNRLTAWAHPRRGETKLLPPIAEDCCPRCDQAAALVRRT